MPWDVTDQAKEAYQLAVRHDTPIAEAMDRLWSRLVGNPLNEGTPLSHARNSTDPHLLRVLEALSKLDESVDPGSKANPANPRISYEPVEGPANPPPWLACSVHVPNWPTQGVHTLVVLGRVNRHGNPKL